MNTVMNEAAYPGEKVDMRELERIGMAAERISIVNDRLIGFASRFRGLEVGGSSGPTPVRSGYQGAIEDLFDKLNALEAVANEITSFG